MLDLSPVNLLLQPPPALPLTHLQSLPHGDVAQPVKPPGQQVGHASHARAYRHGPAYGAQPTLQQAGLDSVGQVRGIWKLKAVKWVDAEKADNNLETI